MDLPGRFVSVLGPFYIAGPTAVGKTDLAVRAAEICGAEIVNADAFQVYAGLSRLTAKPPAEALARVRHHLVGRVPLAEAYNVARYQADAKITLQDIAARRARALVVGGSGLYLKALTHGLSPLPPAQPGLRVELEALELPELITRLETLDPAAATVIDRRNKRRVVRAVEVCLLTGRPVSAQRTSWQEAPRPVRGVLLIRDRDDLAARIRRRTEFLLEEPGLEEVRDARRGAVSETAAGIIGLADVGALLAGEISREQCRERIEAATRRYAKRQMTWFRRESFSETIRLTVDTDLETCAQALAAAIRKTLD